MDKPFTSYRVEERSFVSYLKREIHSEVSHARFSETRAGEIDIIVSELCSNLIKHVGNGEVLYRVFDVGEHDSRFEILCIDKGPGMMDVPRMMKDGMSTANTLGHGLGAIERLSDVSQVYSVPNWGTIVYAKVTTETSKWVAKSGLDVDIRALNVNKPREVVCGDGYRIKRKGAEVRIFFGDGLGHGEFAKEAVDRAGDFFMSCGENDPVSILRGMHEQVRRTRGLVATVAICDLAKNEWSICGIGNILGRMYSGVTYRNYMSYNGTVGLNIPNSMKESVYKIEKNQHLILCSDGIRTRWDLNRFPSVFKYDSTLLAAALYSDFTRRNDDSSILIAKVS
jgi:anti-sigma regulatory factor (Ser/Thr protein kinase)